MPNWKKVIVSGSSPHFNNITASGVITASEFLGPGQVIVSGSSTVGGSTDITNSFKTLNFTGNAVSLVTSAPNTNKLVTVQISTGSSTAFPFTGDAQITGSLIISQSYTSGDTDSTALRLIGSGSVNQSGIFEVEGSAGPLFSVQDGLDGVLMEVNNISGLPLFQVSSSNEVFINRGNLTSGVTTATASFANFSGSFQGDGSNLTNLPPSNPFPFTGDAEITGSLIISASHTSQSLSVIGSGSTVFDVIGSEGTLFSIDDDLDGVIFTANDRTGNPVFQASASGEVYIGKSPQSLYTTAVISSTTADISQSIYGLSTSSYGGVFVDYTANSGSNARAGSIVSVWNGSSINFTETTTLDIGDTSNLLMQVAISQSQAQVQSYATTAGYNIKTIIKAI